MAAQWSTTTQPLGETTTAKFFDAESSLRQAPYFEATAT